MILKAAGSPNNLNHFSLEILTGKSLFNRLKI